MSEDRSPSAFWGTVDLASADLGGEALLASDEFFAGKEHLLSPDRAVFLPEEYTDRGKWMDGWESRRRRTPGHDWCIVRLGVPGRIAGVDIDTDHFLGNHPPFASLDACHAPGATAQELRDEVEWTEVLPAIALERGSPNLAAISSPSVFTHVRLRIYPAGGVARLRVYGEPQPEAVDGRVDLASITAGGRALACSDMFFSPMNNLLLPSTAEHMGQGWETRRSRPPGSDWVIVRLGRAGCIDEVEVDTAHFKGNYPDRCAVDALYWPEAPPQMLVTSTRWSELVPESPLSADAKHHFAVASSQPWTHLRLRIIPDGGVSRLRVWGQAEERVPGEDDALLCALNEASAEEASAAFGRCCGAQRWVGAMVASRPFTSRTHLLGQAECLWWRLGERDWTEAFDHHPKIGADVEALRARFGATASLSEQEQQGVAGADEATLQSLAEGNRDYEERFGFIFIVCASGKSAPEMVALLQGRMDNEPAAELRIAAGEQVKITALRLQSLEL